MRARPVDPRDQTFEVDAPRYRVFFWTSAAQGGNYTADEWELTETDLDDVLHWISRNSHSRPHSLWVVTDNGDGVGHVRLRGIDPTASADTWQLGRPKLSNTRTWFP